MKASTAIAHLWWPFSFYFETHAVFLHVSHVCNTQSRKLTINVIEISSCLIYSIEANRFLVSWAMTFILLISSICAADGRTCSDENSKGRTTSRSSSRFTRESGTYTDQSPKRSEASSRRFASLRLRRVEALRFASSQTRRGEARWKFDEARRSDFQITASTRNRLSFLASDLSSYWYSPSPIRKIKPMWIIRVFLNGVFNVFADCCLSIPFRFFEWTTSRHILSWWRRARKQSSLLRNIQKLFTQTLTRLSLSRNFWEITRKSSQFWITRRSDYPLHAGLSSDSQLELPMKVKMRLFPGLHRASNALKHSAISMEARLAWMCTIVREYCRKGRDQSRIVFIVHHNGRFSSRNKLKRRRKLWRNFVLNGCLLLCGPSRSLPIPDSRESSKSLST